MQTYMNFMGSDFIVDIDWTLTHKGSPARTYGPPEDCDMGEDPEWDIHSITLQHDIGDPEAPIFKATGALFDCLASCRAVDDAIIEYIGEWGEDEDASYEEDYDRDRYDYSDLPDWD